jgi:hypothetical protein
MSSEDRYSASFSSFIFSWSTVITASSAVMSEAGISRSSRNMSMCSGMGTSRAASALSIVDLPQPLRPSRP